jgi:hypothetical protein
MLVKSEVRTEGSISDTPPHSSTDPPGGLPSPQKRPWWITGIRVARSRPVRYLIIVTNIASAVALLFYFPDLFGRHTRLARSGSY